jgi:hypothetical protein
MGGRGMKMKALAVRIQKSDNDVSELVLIDESGNMERMEIGKTIDYNKLMEFVKKMLDTDKLAVGVVNTKYIRGRSVLDDIMFLSREIGDKELIIDKRTVMDITPELYNWWVMHSDRELSERWEAIRQLVHQNFKSWKESWDRKLRAKWKVKGEGNKEEEIFIFEEAKDNGEEIEGKRSLRLE